MKKILLSTLLMVFAIAFTNAQNVETCANAPVSHWSVGLKGGADYFRAAPSAGSRSDRIHLILGGTLEYSITPLAGIGVELLNNPYGFSNNVQKLDASTFDVVPYLSVNLSNLLIPNRNAFWSKVNIFSESGMGVGFYNYSLNNASTTNGKTMLAKTGLNAEYNISKSLALGLEGQYRYYDRATMGGANFSKGHCEALTATIGLRYKFGAKVKQHARNISMCEYNPKPVPAVDTKAKECYQDAMTRLKAAQDQQKALQQKAQQLEQDIKNISTQK